MREMPQGQPSAYSPRLQNEPKSLPMRLLQVLPAAFCLILSAKAEEKPAPIELEMVEGPALPAGTAAYYGGTATEAGIEMRVADLSIFQSIDLAVAATVTGDDIKVELRKDSEETISFEGSTQATGLVQTSFRTEGDFIVRVSTTGPEKDFEILIWAGSALQPPMKSATVPMPEDQK